ncbi:AraC family transcriptional regulator ligand-binding domain-containing protein [Gallaecimonas kandeliae]|uniref:AraC family transcriptional regulator n=1 Tax=Gallaecimonas kandeliae TaxID=3029055 RepID=UPI002649E46B|nr:AraC family transcriptional regulator [Gallaecimonas kandeliae]WKE66825.1 AraC family transcriptional regulator ligand-binding domain-containing protein [Gallaecimonas kandeliae]
MKSCQTDIAWPYLEPLYQALGKSRPEPGRLEAGLYFDALAEGTARWPLFPLDMGLAVRAADYPALGQLLQSCERLDQALAALFRYQWLVARLGEARLEHQGEQALLCWEPWPGVPALAVERNMAGWLAYARFLLGPGYQPQALTFRHQARLVPARYQAKLGCPVRFGAPNNALLFPAAWLSLPLRGDGALHGHLSQYAELQLALLAGGLAERVNGALDSLLGEEVPTLVAVAGRLGLSARQLQRQLAAQGLRFRELQDGWRARQLKALAQRGWHWGEVAAALGYAEQGALIKACRRWYGCTPVELAKKKGP